LIEVTIPLRSHDEAILVLGPYDRHAKLLRQDLDIDLYTHGGNLKLKGEESDVGEARGRIDHLLGKYRKGRPLEPTQIESILVGSGTSGESKSQTESRRSDHGERDVDTRRATQSRKGVAPRSANQERYLDLIAHNSLVFGSGPAGTGKTFLAVAAAVRALRAGHCRRLVITRPVVEAGERLGFLPGDLAAKLNPYMRPIYDALGELLDFEEVAKLEEAGVIEIAPLAYMRGRTLARSFVILDEGQNTTVSQMKMFLTRMGERSRMVVTGDPSQSDLLRDQVSGFSDAIRRLRGFKDVGVVEFSTSDIVRHPLVEQIVKAYEAPLPKEEGRS